MSIDRRIDKEDELHTHTHTHTHTQTHKLEYYSAIKKNEILFAIAWMDLELTILNEVRKRREILYDITYMQNLKYDTNKHIYGTEIDSKIQRRDF